MSRRQPRDFAEFVSYIKERGFHPGTVIDVGVCYGTPELQDGFPEAYHILFEPLAELEPRMKALTTRLKGEYHMMALADAAGELPLAVKEGAIEGATLSTGARAANARIVPVGRLDGVLAGRDLAGPILLKTDCQGYDLKVLQGATGLLPQIDLVVMEVNMFHPAGDRSLADFGEITVWMREQGYAVYDIISYQVRPFDGALGYVDLVFAREDSAFRKHHRWA